MTHMLGRVIRGSTELLALRSSAWREVGLSFYWRIRFVARTNSSRQAVGSRGNFRTGNSNAFGSRRQLFDRSHSIDEYMAINFKEKVNSVVRRIPRGKTMTYLQVARAAGSPRAFRAVGNILNKNYDPAIPCHRVVRSDGTIGGYNRGTDKKMEILKKEGYKFGRRNLDS